MSELYLPPTPNWFTSKSLDTHANYIASSVMGSIFLSDTSFKIYHGCIKDAHLKRINSVMFAKSVTNLGDSVLLASCGEDNEVKVWDVKSQCLLKSHSHHQNTPTCLDWLQTNVISGDSKGNIFKWNYETDLFCRYFPENRQITQLKTAPNQQMVAVGYKHGSIVLIYIETDQMKILFKLKHHEDSVNCIAWNQTSDQLCTSSEDKTIRLWSSEDGQEIKCFQAPKSITNAKKENKSQAKINYTPLCWLKSRFIISSAYNGDLFYIDLEKNESKWINFTSTKAEKPHKKIIYEITQINDSCMLTCSLDKQLSIWNIDSFTQETSICTLNGHVNSIISSPFDPSLYAIACGDSSIKLFNENQLQDKYVKSYSNNIKSEVTQISWHPIKESLIAFGTKDGKVGLMDVLNTNKNALYIYSDYNHSVYTLVWAPNGTILYSVADGKIMQHTVKLSKTLQSETIELYKLINPLANNSSGLTEISLLYSTDLFFFTIGKFDGSIELYRKLDNDENVSKLCTFLNHNKLVTIIKWNSTGTLLASGSNDHNVIIVDFTQVLNNDLLNENLNFISKYKYKLSGHTERITGLSWCAHDENLLASSSFDSTVQIWNVCDGTSVANYRLHSGKVLACLFSNMNKNLIFSGGEDYSLHLWLIDQQHDKTPPEELQILVGKKKKQFFKKINKQKIENAQSVEVKVDEKMDDFILNEKSTHTIPSKDGRSLFQFSFRTNKGLVSNKPLKDCLILFEKLYSNENSNDELFDFKFSSENFNLSLFGNRKSTLDLISHEEKCLHESQLSDKSWIFDFWKGNIGKMMTNTRGKVNDFYISLYNTSLLSNKNDAHTLDYIDQLVNSGDYQKASLFCVALFNIPRAIEIYLKFNQFICALCLAQLRLSFLNKSLFKEILYKYAEYSTQNGDYETSVLCYIRLRDLKQASKVLTRRIVQNDEQKELIQRILQLFSSIDLSIQINI